MQTEGSFTGDSERYKKEGSGNGTSLSIYRGSISETWRVGPRVGDSERHVKEGFGNGASLSLYRLYEGNLEGGLLYRGLQETCNRRIWKWSSSFHSGSIRGPKGT
jgi:hypothetical protein